MECCRITDKHLRNDLVTTVVVSVGILDFRFGFMDDFPILSRIPHAERALPTVLPGLEVAREKLLAIHPQSVHRNKRLPRESYPRVPLSAFAKCLPQHS